VHQVGNQYIVNVNFCLAEGLSCQSPTAEGGAQFQASTWDRLFAKHIGLLLSLSSHHCFAHSFICHRRCVILANEIASE